MLFSEVLHFLHFLHFGAQTLINIGFKSAKKVQKVQRLAFWGKTALPGLPGQVRQTYANQFLRERHGRDRDRDRAGMKCEAPAAGQGKANQKTGSFFADFATPGAGNTLFQAGARADGRPCQGF